MKHHAKIVIGAYEASQESFFMKCLIHEEFMFYFGSEMDTLQFKEFLKLIHLKAQMENY